MLTFDKSTHDPKLVEIGQDGVHLGYLNLDAPGRDRLTVHLAMECSLNFDELRQLHRWVTAQAKGNRG